MRSIFLRCLGRNSTKKQSSPPGMNDSCLEIQAPAAAAERGDSLGEENNLATDYDGALPPTINLGKMFIHLPEKLALIITKNQLSEVIEKVFIQNKWTIKKFTSVQEMLATQQKGLYPNAMLILDERFEEQLKGCDSLNKEHLLLIINSATTNCDSSIKPSETSSILSPTSTSIRSETTAIRLTPIHFSDPQTYLLIEQLWLSKVKLRATKALFTFLDDIDIPVEISDQRRAVQFVNKAYESAVGQHWLDVVSRPAPDLLLMLDHKEIPISHSQNVDQYGSPAKNAENSQPQSQPQQQQTQIPSTSTSTQRQSSNLLTLASMDKWKSLSVATNTVEGQGESKDSGEQFVRYLKRSLAPLGADLRHRESIVNPISDEDDVRNRRDRRVSKSGFHAPALDAPISEAVDSLRLALDRSECFSDLRNSITYAIRMLSSTNDPYTPAMSSSDRSGDRIASDLFDGLIRNGVHTTNKTFRERKKSLSAAMCEAKTQQRSRQSSSVDFGQGIQRTKEIELILNEHLLSWPRFDIIKMEKLTEKRPIVVLGMHICQRWEVGAFLLCDDLRLQNWLRFLESNYHTDNPYHNGTHAADVLQATAYFLNAQNVANTLEHTHAIACILAAIVHDLDHPGRGNAYLINIRHPFALLYNDLSVLENHHAALAFKLTFTDEKVNIFANLARNKFVQLRQAIIDLVLATDMRHHFEHLTKFKQLFPGTENTLNIESTDDRISQSMVVGKMLIKCADISNPARPWPLCKIWAERIVEEYFDQTAEEKKRGLPLTMEVFDRINCNMPLTQCRFVDMFVKEMFGVWTDFADLPHLLDQIDDNYTRWEGEIEQWQKRIEKLAENRSSI